MDPLDLVVVTFAIPGQFSELNPVSDRIYNDTADRIRVAPSSRRSVVNYISTKDRPTHSDWPQQSSIREFRRPAALISSYVHL